MEKEFYEKCGIEATTKTIQQVQGSSKTPLPELALVFLTAFGKRLIDNLWLEMNKK